MVYVPILKIDLPEPRLQELLPGLVTAVLGACTLAFDAVYDFLQPLPPEGQDLLYAATITHLPKEFRKARRRIVELDIRDEDKMSEELETAAFNFYRRKMREDVCGYSDEDTEDVTFRRLMSPDSAAYALNGPTPLDAALLTQDPLLLQQLTAGSSSSQAAAAAVVSLPPSRARRVTVTTAVGGAGLALGAGVVKLVRIVSSRLQRQKRKAKGQRRASAAGGAAAAGSRRQSEARRSSTAGGRTTPRQQQR